jgi:integrase
MPRRLPPGVYKDAHGFRAVVHVRPLPLATRRFARDTPVRVITDWRDETRAKLLRRRRLRHAGPAGTLAQDVTRYFQQWGRDVHPVTYEARARHLKMWVDAFPGRSRWSLTPTEIRTQLVTWQQAKDWRPATVDKVRLALFELYAVLDRGTGEPNPVALVPNLERRQAWRTRAPRGISYALVQTLLESMPESKTWARLSVMAYTGLRPAEVQRLRPEDVRASELVVRTAKGGPAVVVPLLPQAVTALEAFARLQAWGPYATRTAARTWRGALRRCGVTQDVRPYDLRHSFGTEVYRVTGDVKVTAELMRHSSIAMTERYVASAVGARVSQALSQVAAGLAGNQPGNQTSAQAGTTPHTEAQPETPAQPDVAAKQAEMAPTRRRRAG